MPQRVLRPSSLRLACAASGLALIVAGCASSPAEQAGLRPRLAAAEPTAVAPAAPEIDPDASLYGLFLAGEAALDKGSSEDAARFLGRASEIDPSPYLKERAFTAAVIAGQIGQAAKVPLADGEGSAAAERLGRLVRGVEALANDKGAEALAALRSDPAQGQTAQAVALLTPWAAAAAGDWDTALAEPAQGANSFATFGRARLLERAGRLAEAEAVLKTLTAKVDNGVFVVGYGGFLERRGRRTEAIALYDRALAKAKDVDVVAARERAKAGRGAPPQPTLQEGAGQALLAPAATLITRRQPELGLAMMRLALRLDPKLDDAWLLVGDAMAAAGDVDAARAAFNHIPTSSLKYPAAQGRLAWSLQRAGDGEGALALAREALSRAKDDPQALSLYADLLRENDRYDESIEVMDRLIAKNGGGVVEPWRLYYLRGVAYERSGRWEKAEVDLAQALKLRPEDPDVMNYLGFGWANRRQHLQEAFDLLQKAAALRPRSGPIRDSLGWARYRLGRYDEAVRDLERAVQLSPAEPDINDHLGDAYWQVGRKLEARFQWSRVLTLDPDAELRAAAEAKLAGGLTAPGATPSDVAAAARVDAAATRP